MGNLAEFPKVPIVGLAYKFRGFTSAVVISCTCSAGTDLVVHDILQGSAMCPACKRRFFVDSLHYDRAKSELSINLGQIVSVGGPSEEEKN